MVTVTVTIIIVVGVRTRIGTQSLEGVLNDVLLWFYKKML